MYVPFGLRWLATAFPFKARGWTRARKPGEQIRVASSPCPLCPAHEPEKDSWTPMATVYGFFPALDKRTHFSPRAQ